MKFKNICVSFAGPIGSSKSPVANYLSTRFNLPIFNNDNIRTEVIEDLGYLEEEVFKKRWQERLNVIVEKEISFIYDASIDRYWKRSLEKFSETKYKFFIISMDMSKSFLKKLYRVKNYSDSLERIETVFIDHQDFVKGFNRVVNVSINDENFRERMKVCERALGKWLEEIRTEK